MKLNISKSKSNTMLYMAKTYRNEKGKSASKIIERSGTLEEIKEKANGKDPIVWAKKYIEEKTKEENENNPPLNFLFTKKLNYSSSDISTDLNNNYDFDLYREFIGMKNMKKFFKF